MLVGAATRSDNLRRVNGSFEDKFGAGEGAPRSMRMRRQKGDQLNEVQRRDIAALFGAEPPVALEAEMGLIGAIV